MPLNHKPGEAQVDFGYALVKVSGLTSCQILDIEFTYLFIFDPASSNRNPVSCQLSSTRPNAKRLQVK